MTLTADELVRACGNLAEDAGMTIEAELEPLGVRAPR